MSDWTKLPKWAQEERNRLVRERDQFKALAERSRGTRSTVHAEWSGAVAMEPDIYLPEDVRTRFEIDGSSRTWLDFSYTRGRRGEIDRGGVSLMASGPLLLIPHVSNSVTLRLIP